MRVNVVYDRYPHHPTRSGYPVLAEGLAFVPLGIDWAYYCPGKRSESHRVIFVGEHRRDFDALFEVAARCSELDPGLRFEVISTAEHVAALSSLPNVTARSRVSDEELVRSYRSASVLLLPLLSATANNALLEGMSRGLPVIATDVGGVREYVDEHGAILVEPGDSQGMVRTVLDLIGDRSRRERMGLASRRRALSFDWAPVAERQLDVYRQALAQRRAGRASARRSGIRSALKRACALRELVLGCLAGETPCRRPPAPGGP